MKERSDGSTEDVLVLLADGGASCALRGGSPTQRRASMKAQSSLASRLAPQDNEVTVNSQPQPVLFPQLEHV